jgi:hypothetical protein
MADEMEGRMLAGRSYRELALLRPGHAGAGRHRVDGPQDEGQDRQAGEGVGEER